MEYCQFLMVFSLECLLSSSGPVSLGLRLAHESITVLGQQHSVLFNLVYEPVVWLGYVIWRQQLQKFRCY